MTSAWDLYRREGPLTLWNRCLGFLDWSLDETVSRQLTALDQQLARIRSHAVASGLVGGSSASSIKEFRDSTPLTGYEDYASTLGERDGRSLLQPPATWLRTSGRDDGSPKWLPLSPGAREQLAWTTLGLCLAASASKRGDVGLSGDLRILDLTAPPPYFSGTAVASMEELGIWPMRVFPEHMSSSGVARSFDQRAADGFRAATQSGVDIVLSYASVLAGIGEAVRSQPFPWPRRASLRAPRLLLSLARAHLSAGLHGRSIQPRDLWQVKGVIVGGMDAALFRESIRDQWGADPLEVLGSTEGLFIGMQTWQRSSLTLIPHFNFFEFLPWATDDTPGSTVDPHEVLMMNEIAPDRTYELIITNLLDGALIRYRTGERLRVVALQDRAANIQLPQFVYEGRRSAFVEIAGFARLSQRSIEQAFQANGLFVSEWTVRKELESGKPVVHLRMEPPPTNTPDVTALTDGLDRALAAIDHDWSDLAAIARIRPLRVSYLPSGTFEAVRKTLEFKRIARVNPDADVMDLLLSAADSVRTARAERLTR